VGGNEAKEVRQLVYPSYIHMHAMLLLAAEQVLAVRQPECVHHVRHVREKLLYFSQTGVRPIVEKRDALGGSRQGK